MALWFPIIFGGAVLLIIAVAILLVVFIARRAIRTGLNAYNAMDALSNLAGEAAQTPRTLQNLTQTYSGLIKRDFPEFDTQEFLTRAENTLVAVLTALEAQYIDPGADFSANLLRKVQGVIDDIRSKGERWYFDDLHIHKSCIARYSATQGMKTIRCEIAMEYAHRIERGGQIRSGSCDIAQYKYTVDAVYIQDVSKLGSASMAGHNCPNCGAPVIDIGEGKFCRYCGTGLSEVNVRVWTFDNYSRC